MALPALPAPVQTAIDKLRSFFNGGIWVPATPSNPGNPGGLDGDGHAVNFVPALRDAATALAGVATFVLDVLAEIRTTAARFEGAVAAIKQGPVNSVQVGDGPVQVGAVVINLDTLSAEVEAEIAKVRETQAALAATQADITDSAQSYALAFGG